MEEQSQWSKIRIVGDAPKMKAAPKPFAVGDGWQDVKVIGRNLRGDLPNVPRPGKPSRHDGDGDGFFDANGDGIDKEPAPKVVEEAVDAVQAASKWSDADQQRLVEQMVPVSWDEGTLEDLYELVGLRLRRPIEPLTDEELRIAETLELNDVYRMREGNRIVNGPPEFSNEKMFRTQDLLERFAIPRASRTDKDKTRLINYVSRDEYVWDGKNWVQDKVMGVPVAEAGHKPRVLTREEAEALFLPADGVERAVSVELGAVSPAKKKKPKRSGPTPAQLAAQERNRAAAAEQQAQREEQQVTEEARKLETAAAEEQQRAERLAADADNAAAAEAMVREAFKPLTSGDISDRITTDTAKTSVRVKALRQGDVVSDEDIEGLGAIGVPIIRSKFSDFSANGPRVSEEGQKQTEEMTVRAVSESPLLRQLVERDGLPPVVIFDSISSAMMESFGYQGFSDMPLGSQAMIRREEMSGTLGYHQAATGIVAINGNVADAEPSYDKIPSLDRPEVWGVSDGALGTLRHELGHWQQGIALEREDSFAAAREMEEYYDRVVAPAAEARQKLSAVADPRAQQTLSKNELRRISESAIRQRDLMEPTAWLSPYGHSDSAEFFAETFAMLSSPDPEVRAAVPEEVKSMLARVLDMDLSKL